MSDLYNTDILAWSERQGELLHRIARGERVNDDDLDWPNIAEEIESVGSEQLHAVESLLVNILEHRLQIMAWPDAAAVPHWQHEIDGWRAAIRRRLRRAPSLRTAIERDLAELYSDALIAMYREVDGVPRPPMPPACPWTLDELLAEP